MTILGVIIGTSSVVVMVSIGIGMNQTFHDQIEQMGSLQIINVSAGSDYIYSDSGTRQKNNKKAELNSKAIQDFMKIDGVETATPVENKYLTLICGRYTAGVTVYGVDPKAMPYLGYSVQEGGALFDETSGDVILVGQNILTDFRNPKMNWQMQMSMEPPQLNLMEEKVSITSDHSYGTKDANKAIKPVNVKVVGILDGDGETSYNVYMPLSLMEKVKKAEQKGQTDADKDRNNQQKKGVYNQALVKAKETKQVTSILNQIKDMGFEAYSLTEYLESTQKTSRMMQIVLGAIGAVSLFVAAIGITNTMIMSIYERTREIGIMKVIGASLGDIRRLFLTEAAFIGFSGGLIGLLLSELISLIINVAAGDMFSSSIPLWLALASIVFATMVGLLAGYFPARRAMNLSALSAIKTE